ncbi:uncharacterized protein LOC130924521 isoform X2 [Corythoichthys intestinalis]|uniref:uncharacterized protein LOC130924521 isoform X2 n=1 Tax=Corythoichthys intestinalis TaxID=161448 RepID=UPI0025A60EE7|nr:uncharacterized protein LOC130924521 isoform X2 [Corythoichthys intestinalis]
MRSTLGLVLLLIVSQGVSKRCDGRKEGAQCYGQLDGEIEIKLMDIVPNNFYWYREKQVYYRWRNGRASNLFARLSKLSFTPINGTMKMVNLTSTDSGNYSLRIFDDNGRSVKEWTIQLFIEAPVATIHLVLKILSNGEQLVYCSSKRGDNLQYRWSLNQKPLQDTDLVHGHVQASNITLKRHISGQLVCAVRNNVSENQEGVYLCCDLGLIIRTVVLSLIIFIVIGVVIYILKRCNKTHEASTTAHPAFFPYHKVSHKDQNSSPFS